MAEEAGISRRAAIDIGTNTVLLLVAEIEAKKITPLFESQLLPRIGKGVDKTRNISWDAIHRTAEAVNTHLKEIHNRFGQIPVYVTATSAVRDARNREEVLELFKKLTGYPVQLISGDEEANLTFTGALSMVSPVNENTVVVDIGGGSTELIAGNSKSILSAHSYDMGCVRYTERYLSDLPAAEEAVKSCRKEIGNELKQNKLIFSGYSDELIGVAGTVTSLAALHQNQTGYDPERINGYSLSLTEIDQFTESLSLRSHEEIEQMNPTVMKGRSDIMLAGLLILAEIMHYWNFRQLKVSTGGLRHGVLIWGSDQLTVISKLHRYKPGCRISGHHQM